MGKKITIMGADFSSIAIAPKGDVITSYTTVKGLGTSSSVKTINGSTYIPKAGDYFINPNYAFKVYYKDASNTAQSTTSIEFVQYEGASYFLKYIAPADVANPTKNDKVAFVPSNGLTLATPTTTNQFASVSNGQLVLSDSSSYKCHKLVVPNGKSITWAMMGTGTANAILKDGDNASILCGTLSIGNVIYTNTTGHDVEVYFNSVVATSTTGWERYWVAWIN